MEGPRPEDARVGNFPVNTAEDISPLETDDVTESPDDVKEKVGNGQPVKQGNVIKGKSKEKSETHGAARGGGGGGGEGRGGSRAPVFNKDLDEKFAPGVEEPGQESEEEFEEDWIENEIGEEEGKGGSVVKTTMERVSIFEEDPPEELEMQRPGETGSPDQACAYWPEEEPEAMQYEQRAKQVQREEAERGEEMGDVTYYQPRPLDITPTSSAVPEDVIEDAAGVNRAFIMRDKIGYPCRGTDPSTASALRLLSKRSHGAEASLLAGMADLWIAQECTDIELLVETTVFRCHRTVLAAVSGYFRSMLASGMRESHSLRMHVSEVNADTMAAVLEEVYQQRDDVITPENVDMIFRAAAFLQISFLETACCDVMKRCITADNCLGVWRLGKAHNRTDLEKAAVAIIREEFTEVVQSEEFVDLEVVDLRDLLAALPVDESIGEEERVKSILTWGGGRGGTERWSPWWTSCRSASAA